MEDTIKEILATILELERNEINESTTSENMENWDSLNHLKIVDAIEEVYHVKLDEEQMLRMFSYQDILTVLQNVLSE